jgi:hypothetical protein
MSDAAQAVLLLVVVAMAATVLFDSLCLVVVRWQRRILERSTPAQLHTYDRVSRVIVLVCDVGYGLTVFVLGWRTYR